MKLLRVASLTVFSVVSMAALADEPAPQQAQPTPQFTAADACQQQLAEANMRVSNWWASARSSEDQVKRLTDELKRANTIVIGRETRYWIGKADFSIKRRVFYKA